MSNPAARARGLPRTSQQVAADPDAAARRFSWLYDREHANVLRFVLRRLPSSDVTRAEDITADVFLAAWRRLDEINAAEPSERAWLFAAARHSLLHEQRASIRRDALAIRLAEHSNYQAPGPDQVVGPRLDVAAAWARLKPGEQEVLALDVWEGLSSAEAGRVLGISAGAYRQLGIRC